MFCVCAKATSRKKRWEINDKGYSYREIRRNKFDIDVRMQLATSIYTECKIGSLCVVTVPGRRLAGEAVRAVEKKE